MKPDTIRPVSQRNQFMNFLLYGLPGIGKTFLAGTGKSTLMIDCGFDETDTNAAAGHAVDVWEVHSLTQLEEAYEYLRHEGYKDYKWAWIDGLSPLEGRLMRELLVDTVAAHPHRSLYIPDKAEYLKIQSYIDRFVQLLCDVPMHMGFTAHVAMENTKSFDEDNDEVDTLTIMPMVQGGKGKLAQKVCGYMNIVGYLDTIEGSENQQVRAMLVRGDGRHIAKDRFDVLGNKDGWLMNPTIPKIEAAVSAKLAAAPRKVAAKKTGGKKVAAKKTAAKKTPTKAALRRR